MRIRLLILIAPWLLQAEAPISEVGPKKVNYPANFQVEEGADFFLFGDYLYWGAGEDGLYYARSETELLKIDPGYDSGLRIGAGINFPRAGYEIALSWLWFKTDSHSQESGTLTPLWAEPSSFITASTASGHWHLNMNLLDLEWGRASWFGGSFSLKPFFGLRGAWIEQDLHNQFTYETAPVTQSSLKAQSDFTGGGLRAGADGRFTVGYGLAVYGLISGSLLYGHFNADAHTREEDTLLAQTRDRFNQGLSSVQMAMGLGWDRHFAKDRYHIELHAAWEQNIWFGMNKMNHYLDTLGEGHFFQEKGNLSIQGLTVGGRFDF